MEISDISTLAKFIDLQKKFDIKKAIGSGSFGAVFKVVKKADGIEYALKIVKDDGKNVEREVKVLAKLNGMNTVRYYDSWKETIEITESEYLQVKQKINSESRNFLSELSAWLTKGRVLKTDDLNSTKDDNSANSIVFSNDCKHRNCLFILMEYCGKQTLREAIDDDLYLDEYKLKKYYREIVKGLNHIHSMEIVHRDLKPNNIFLTQDNTIKIGDFGLAKEYTNNFEDRIEYSCGTNIYIAPEMSRRENSGPKADMYSLGVILLEMSAKLRSAMEIVKLLPFTKRKLNQFDSTQLKFFKYYKNIIILLTNNDYTKRPTCDELLKKLDLNETSTIIKQKIEDPNIPHQQLNLYKKILTSRNKREKKREKKNVFELFGGQLIKLPNFTPQLKYYTDDVINLVNTSGHTVSVPYSSRMQFCEYVASNNIDNFRRYSIDTSYKENEFLPFEETECVFECISSNNVASVLYAELLYMTKMVFDKTYKLINPRLITFIINHGILYKMLHEDSPNLHIHYNINAKDFITSRTRESRKPKTKNQKQIEIAFKLLENTIKDASKYGIDVKDIVINSALKTQNYWSSFMFNAIIDDKVVAVGERFESIMKTKSFGKYNKKRFAIGVTFLVDKIPIFDEVIKINVIIFANKFEAIPLQKKLVDEGIICRGIVNSSFIDVLYDDIYFAIEMENNDVVRLFKVKDPEKIVYMQIFKGSWKHADFIRILKK